MNEAEEDDHLAPSYAEEVQFSRTLSDAAPFKKEERLANLLAGIFLAGIAVVCVLPLFSHEPWMIFVQDDLLYYLKVAQNIAHGHGSTFNGLVPTNGYQPLWLLMLVALSWMTTNGSAILGAIAVMNVLASAATLLLARSLIHSSGVRPLLAFALAAVVTLYSLTLFFYGMEVTLTVPIVLGVAVLLRRTVWLRESALHAFGLGLLLSAMVLSRIDTLILGGLLLAGIVATPALRTLIRLRVLLGLALGLLPIPLYFALNHALFQTWLPISGMAKELKFTHTPSLEPWRVFFHPLAAGYAVLLLFGLLLAFHLRARLAPMERILFPAVLLFPFVYYSILCCVSDWTLWGWYMYPIRTALCISLVLFCLWPASSKGLQKPLATGALVFAVFSGLALTRWRRQQVDIYAASTEIAQFAAAHPGTYAMGDRAGRVAYLIPNPIVQTEGLMMDRVYLDRLKSQQDLRSVLSSYHTSYYVATAYEPFTGCFHAAEPAKAGPASAHLRSTFCEAPVATFFHEGIETLIFDLTNEKDEVRQPR